MRKPFFRFGQWLAWHRQLVQARDRRHRSAGATWTGLEALEDRAFLSTGPTVGSVTATAVDTIPPSVTINQAAAQVDPATASPVNFTVVFSEPVNDFATGDVTLTGSAGNALVGTVTGSGTTYNVAVSGMTATGTVIATLKSGVAHDASNNPSLPSTSTDNNVQFNEPANHPPSGTDTVIATVVNTPYTFAATDFGFSDASDTPANTLLAVKIATLPAAGTLSDNGVAVTAGQSILVADINGGKLVFTPAAGATGSPYAAFTFQVQDNGGTANGGVDLDPSANNMTINVTATDTTGPTVRINKAAGQADPTGLSPVNFTVVFSEPVTDFTSGDIVLTGTANATTATITGSGTTYNVAVTGMTTSGNVSAALAAGVVHDAAGNANLASTSVDNIVAFVANHPPSGADKTISTLANMSHTFTVADFGFSDAGDTPANTLLAVKIATLPTTGTLTDNGTNVAAAQSIPVADINSGKLIYTAGANSSSFTFQVQDNGGTAGGGIDTDAQPNTITINVTSTTRGDKIVLTANNIVDPGAAIKSVDFWVDGNNDGVLDTGDHRLGSGKLVPGTSNYSLTTGTKKFGVSSDSVTGGSVTNKIFAVVTDTAHNKTTASSSAIVIDSHSPSISKLELVNTPVLSAGNALELRALGVRAHDGAVVTSVSFFYDANNDGILNPGTDTLLGTDSAWPNGWTVTTNAPTSLPTTGTVHFFAVVTDSDGTTSNVETLTTKVDAPPVIGTLTATPSSATRGTATNVTLTASNVTDSDGTVKDVRFYFDSNGNGTFDIGDKLLGTSRSNTSTFTANGTVPATLITTNATFFAVAEDNKGATSTVSTLQVPVSPPSIGSLTVDAPLVGGVPVVERGESLTLTASNFALNNGQPIASVQFFIDSNNNGKFDSGVDTLIGTDTTAALNGSYSFTYSVPATATTGPTTFFAVATDSGTPALTSPATSVAVTIGPTVGSLTSNYTTVPVGISLPQATPFILTASNIVVANGKSVSKVEFFLDANGNGTFDSGTDTDLGPGVASTTTPGNYTFTDTQLPTTTPTGNDTFFAVAFDNAATPIASSAASVKVAVTPSIATASFNAPTIGIGQPFTLSATGVTTTASNTISSVQFFLDSNGNGTFDPGTDAIFGVGSLNNGVYQLIESMPSSTPTGHDTFFAVATDSNGIKSQPLTFMENITPSVGTFTTVPATSVTAGANLKLVAGSVVTGRTSGTTSSTTATITSVKFYLDVNNNGVFDATTDTLIGSGAIQVDGTYTLNYTIPADTAAGPLAFLAVATDSNGVASLPASVTGTVSPAGD